MNIRAYAHLVPLVPYVMIGAGLLFVAPDELIYAAMVFFLVKFMRTNSIMRANTAETEHQNNPTPSNDHKSGYNKGHSGVIAALGRDYYQFDQSNSKSFFIQLRDDAGRESTFWGIDLQRLAKEEHLAPGDHVQLEFLGKQPVEVVRKVRNANGVVVGTEKIQAHRNQWSATKLTSS